MLEWDVEENKDIDEEVDTEESREIPAFEHRAIPLDKLETLDSEGNRFSIKELMQLKDLREELGE